MPFSRFTYASRLCLNVVQLNGAVSAYEKPYALASLSVSEMAAAFQVTFFGTQLPDRQHLESISL